MEVNYKTSLLLVIMTSWSFAFHPSWKWTKSGDVKSFTNSAAPIFCLSSYYNPVAGNSGFHTLCENIQPFTGKPVSSEYCRIGLLCLFVKHCCVPFLQCYYKPASHSVNQFGLTFVCLSCLYFFLDPFLRRRWDGWVGWGWCPTTHWTEDSEEEEASHGDPCLTCVPSYYGFLC